MRTAVPAQAAHGDAGNGSSVTSLFHSGRKNKACLRSRCRVPNHRLQCPLMRRFLFMLTLVLAGEMIFSLPFHTARFFRPTLLEVFGFTNTQLGDVFAVYGITAMLSYFPGGVIADRFPARSLMTFSLLATAAGGLYMATFPGELQMALLYGYWGVTTIFLFWAALISATREWGGAHSQGKAFGILDGGRGLAAAAFALFATGVLATYFPLDAAVSPQARREGFRTVILLYSTATALAGVLCWLLLPKTIISEKRPGASAWRKVATVLRRPVTWAQAGVVVFAYCGFKGLDNYALYAVEVLGMDEIEAARFTAWAAYLRPLAAVSAGLVADRFCVNRTILITFLLLTGSFILLASTNPLVGRLLLVYGNLLFTFFAVFALRGVYFALIGETGTPKHLTGTTVGIVSFIGFTPEIFFAPIGGRLLDAAPGIAGHQHYFAFLAICAALGAATSAWLAWMQREGRHKSSSAC